MSKRRKRESDFEAEEKENIEGEKISERKAEKSEGIGTKRVIVYSVILVAISLGIGMFFGPAIVGYSVMKPETNDQFIFISPPGCTNCAVLEPMAKDVADTLGITFLKTGFAQQIQSPGFVLIYNDVLTISGMEDEFTLKSQICLLTENKEICDRANELQPAEQPPAPEVPKSDKPEAHAFIMSYCPYGLQFLKAYVPVIELLGDKADLEVNFVHYLMHGEEEMDENTRMYCIQKEQKDKFTDYLRCFVEAGDAEGCVSNVGIDSSALDACIQKTDDEFQITKTFQESTDSFPRYDVDALLAQLYGVGGSPTFGINGQQISVNRSPEAIKQAVCSAFNSPPEECSQILSTAGEAPGLGPIGSGGGSSGSDAQC